MASSVSSQTAPMHSGAAILQFLMDPGARRQGQGPQHGGDSGAEESAHGQGARRYVACAVTA